MTGDAYNNAISLLHQRYRRPNFTGNAITRESTAVMQLISEKFPEYTRSKLAKQKHKHGKAWKTSQLLAALDAIIEQQEAVNYFK
ncbi:hypothetical protein Aduo_000589 [Ancylostoma duodenale]